MNINKIMKRRIFTVERDDTLELVKNIFDTKHFHHLLVVEKRELLGVVSDRDLFKAISPNSGKEDVETRQDAEMLQKKVHQIMSRQLVTLTETATLNDAIHVFNAFNISCIPIVDHNNRPRGLITWRDVMRAMEPSKAA